MSRIGILALLLAPLLVAAADPSFAPAPAGLDARAVMRRAEASLRSERWYCEATMRVSSRRKSDARDLRFRAYYDQRRRRSFLRVSAPESEAGTGFLLRDPNLWVYVPRLERTLLAPKGVLDEPWLGSDFRHDEMLVASSPVEDYDHRVLGIDAGSGAGTGGPSYVLESSARSGSAPVWPRLVSWVDVLHGTPRRREFYAADGALQRVLEFADLRETGGRWFPHLWILTPVGGELRETRIEIALIRFDGGFDDVVFTTGNLKSAP